MENLQIMIEYYPNGTIFHLLGEINIFTIEKLKKKFNTLELEGIKNFLLDFFEVYYIDSSGFGFLVKKLKQLKKIDGNLFFMNIKPEIENTLKFLNFDKIFNIITSDVEVIDIFNKKVKILDKNILLISFNEDVTGDILYILNKENLGYVEVFNGDFEGIKKIIKNKKFDLIIYELDEKSAEIYHDILLEIGNNIPVIFIMWKISKNIFDKTNLKGKHFFVDRINIEKEHALVELVNRAFRGEALEWQDQLMLNYKNIVENFKKLKDFKDNRQLIFEHILGLMDYGIIVLGDNQNIIYINQFIHKYFPYLNIGMFFCDTDIYDYTKTYMLDFFKKKLGSINIDVVLNNVKYNLKAYYVKINNNEYRILIFQEIDA